MNRENGKQLDPRRRSKAVEEFERELRHKIVGQHEAVDALVDLFQMFLAGLNSSGRPVGSMMFLGPTGTGKTRCIQAAAEILFGDEHSLIKIDCGEFQHSHEISKLVGSPPGYLGHRETHPRLHQDAINKFHTPKLRLTFILFDEIEKASDALWQLLLSILDEGVITLGDNSRVDMSSCVIVLTSNVGAQEMGKLAEKGIGFVSREYPETNLSEKIQRTALEQAKKKFSPEFINRIDKYVVFKKLELQHLEKILELELHAVQQHILKLSGKRFLFTCTAEVKDKLLHEGYDPKYGARPLKRTVQRNLVFPFSNLLSTGQIKGGELIRVALVDNSLSFSVEKEDIISSSDPNQLSELAESAPIKKARKNLKEAEDRLQQKYLERYELKDSFIGDL